MPTTPATTITMKISGLSCASCVGRAERAIVAVSGVVGANINLASETAQVDPGSVAPGEIADALDKAGYPAEITEALFDIEEMHCASCAGRIETALLALPGVVAATVNPATETASVRWFAGAVTPEQIAQVSGDAGYPATLRSAASAMEDDSGAVDRSAALGRDVAIAAALTLPVFVMEMGSHFIPGVHDLIAGTIGIRVSWLIQFALVTLVMVWPGRRILFGGARSLLRGAPDMNALVALGTSAAWMFSTVALFAPGLLPVGTQAVYYEAAAVIITLILLGRWLELRAKGRTGAAIRALAGLQPRTAMVLRDGALVETEIAQIRQGDLVQIRPGERIAVDGTVTAGASFVDESMITGEAAPVERSVSAPVVGGTVNGTGALTVRATAVGADTVLASIVRMVEQAQGAKLPIQAMVDRVVMWFVPAVMAVAAVTVAVWLIFGPAPALPFALVAGVSVLIVACPCAMGLATPVSVMVGSGRAAQLGVLFRKGDALQSLSGVSVIAFDKTGTLTQGRPELTDFTLAESAVAGGQDRDGVLARIAAVESLSEHPVASAIVRAAAGLTLPAVDGFDAINGMGVRGQVDGLDIIVGADRLMAQEGIEIADLAPLGLRIGERGRTPLYAAIDGRAVAVLGVADPVRPTSRAALDALRTMGLRLAMITGDNRATAQAIANDLGISEVEAEVMPDGKVAALERLRAHGTLAFVGDGINDAPALAAADVGIAVGTGTDVAIETADVVLMSGDPVGVVRAIAVSRATIRNIRQNLFWAFAYNIALIPVAAGALYPLTGTLLSPMLAAGAMALSSLFVLSNALRLRRAADPAAPSSAKGAKPALLEERTAL
ncbi:heavy metal translocating P-type ATPase [Oceaniovalibus sp. ACAM 378]|uniref:heavy metal translocating P-type ATPase n=1 Tax=Oceaniovalibus sp. ACAM 378 TaxID=2599923 RepID=UPI0011D7A864|nr:heavy metal translocating P-type ATPase [Oceaniovalibus sp. ACAM 378]TYB90752.1 cadmium-translocating P-type ATPase [Oceaniovalibus sp. ACAM 378]